MIDEERYKDYENLLMRRDAIRKEGESLALEYIRVFGQLIADVFRKKIECIEKKKKIAVCQACVNRGKPIIETEADNYIRSTMAEYYDELDSMLNDLSFASDVSPITLSEKKKIKEIYRYLAKLIHPDKRPDLAEDEMIQMLWREIYAAYTYNDLASLEELKFRTENYLDQIDGSRLQTPIPDLENRIAIVCDEIETLINSNPYQYRQILRDHEAVEKKKRELQEELESYISYSAQLEDVLQAFPIRRFDA